VRSAVIGRLPLGGDRGVVAYAVTESQNWFRCKPYFSLTASGDSVIAYRLVVLVGIAGLLLVQIIVLVCREQHGL
jgi:hypothetical protein